MDFLNDTERIILAEYIAADNLAHANELSEPVHVKNTIYSKYIKRLIDIILSAIALIITSPVNLVIAVVTYFDVGRPIFFHQVRIGKDCRKFEIIKFRNMTNDTDAQGNLLPPRERVTKWGKFVRKTSLDELLNFWSVFKGDMSIIGPRPLVTNYLNRYSDRHKQRHAVRPGLECPDISGITHTGNRWQDYFENDIWYVENVSFITDVKMVFALVRLVFNRKETKRRSKATTGSFMGYREDGMVMDNSEIPQKYIDRMHEEYGTNISKATLAGKEKETIQEN